MGEVRSEEPEGGEGLVDEPSGAEEPEATETGEESGQHAESGAPPAPLTEVLEYLARHLVEFPDAVKVSEEERDGAVALRLKVDQRDMGKVIGRGGRVARALRSVMRAAGTRAGVVALVEIVEEGGSGG
jgi:predicted RNA-binding protein YlqC (UPF0109 family)